MKHPLLRAVVSEEDPETVQYLVDAGANIEAVNNSGNTPLSYAVKKDWHRHMNERQNILKQVEFTHNPDVCMLS